MTHQLMPKEEWTKPEEVRLPLRAQRACANKLAGHPISCRNHHRHRVRDGRARGSRGNGHHQEEGKRIKRTLDDENCK
jgi:hypothetical protein